MPTYEYECSACGHQFEKFQAMNDQPIRKCPACGKKKVQRMISGGAGVLFKGSGFYQTDYRSQGYRESAKKDKAPTSTPTCSGACDSCPAKN
ncbi:MAG TPA: zinc ribbon domain-containing protein [Candidatus Omnitrophota bacterium]|jgi:putative FmdB family regulatory protein|nr:zinc ribbon domain-containing protein [Candidatus Omnitrophota bacterium]HPW76329.1 zinc ribbon domain-containing protein [Candidatus Omnitrophota bacterium]HQB12280.1 zinc ribbon domain-containing protein [Candidatus Omnitrophota bacterium]